MEAQVCLSESMYLSISLFFEFGFLFFVATGHYFSCSYSCVRLLAVGITEVLVICTNPNSFVKMALYCPTQAFSFIVFC